MLHRALPEMPRIADADLEDAGTAASEAAAARAEHHLRLLGELTEIGMELSRSLGVLAKARVEAAVAETRALTAADDASVAGFNKAAQTVRRTIALHDRLDSLTARRHSELTAERTRRRAERDTAHAEAKANAVVFGVHDAWAAGTPKDEYDETVERVMEDVREHLLDVDEFRGWLDRPVGETVSRICKALGVDPGACVRDGREWIIHRPPTEFERHLPLSPSGEEEKAAGAIICRDPALSTRTRP